MDEQIEKTRIYITYHNGFANVTIDEGGTKKQYPTRFKNDKGKDTHEFCSEVAKTIEEELGKEVEWSLSDQGNQKGPIARRVITVLVFVLAAIGLIFICMIASSYMRISNEKAATKTTTTESSSVKSSEEPKTEKMSQEEYEELYKEANPFEFGEGYNDSNQSYNRYVGTIKNVSNTTHYFIKVRGTFTDDDGNSIDTDWTYACGADGLRPGESKKFTLSVQNDSRITRISYEVFDYQ